MTSYNPEDFSLLEKECPDLYYEKSSNTIKGELSFNACYANMRRKGRDNWMILPCFDGCDCLQVYYEIQIKFNNGRLIVYETSKKIQNLAEKLGRSYNDLHLYEHDNKCCLGIGINPNLSISKFITNWVRPYFVWQAYYAKYHKTPPSGEYDHDPEKARAQFNKNKKDLSANSICFCGSGEKYKKCCSGK